VGQIRQPQQDAAISAGLSTYLVYQEGGGGGGGGGGGAAQFGEALVNALVIVGVICAATFVLVLCYYFRCLKLMIGYLIFASVNLLGYSGGFMAISAIQLAQWPVDWASLVFVMYNFAIGGAVAVFWQKGIPRIVTQGYLIAVSVIMSWLVTKLPEVRRESRRASAHTRSRAHACAPNPRTPPAAPRPRSGPRGRCSSCWRCTTCARC
jgi:presenilin 1